MRKVYRCQMGSKDRVYVIEDTQRPLFNEPYSFTIRFGRRNRWLRRKHICCESLANKEKRIAKIDRLRKQYGYRLEGMN